MVRRYKEICENENIQYENHNQLNFTTYEPDCFILTTGWEIVKISEILQHLSVVVGRHF